MSLGFYRVIKGKLIVRERQSPDGDSMRFVADNPGLFEDLPNFEPASESRGLASYQLRFQAIDTPELHYGGAEQPHGRESRDGLLRWLGVDPADWNWEVAPRGFEWEQPAVILCDGFENHGRPISFVFREIDAEDGSDLKLARDLLLTSYNHFAVKTGLAYLGIYTASLAFGVEGELLSAYRHARAAKTGIWTLDRSRRFVVNTLDDLTPETGSLIYPKIFRRCVDALRWAGGEFEPGRDLDDFLAEKSGEDDRFVVQPSQGGRLTSRLSQVLEQINNRIRIQVDLNTVQFVSK